MHLVYTGEFPPQEFSRSIFLAGPSPRIPTEFNWRSDAIRILEELGYDGVVFVPLYRNPPSPEEMAQPDFYGAQAVWEAGSISSSDSVVFWIPRTPELLGLTTNVEFGMLLSSGKCVLGYPAGAMNMEYLRHQAICEGVPVSNELESTLRLAVNYLQEGSFRSGGETQVPLHIWRTPSFQSWVATQKAAGNRLDGARLLWNFRVGRNKSFVLAYALRVIVWVASEKRHKSNEFIIGRPDISMLVAHGPIQIDLWDTELLIIKEFRSTASTPDGFVRDLPGGSSFKPDLDPLVVMAKELEEESGLGASSGFPIDPTRVRKVGVAQPLATLSTHRAHVFAIELTLEEIAFLRQQEGVSHGVAAESERTYVEVRRLSDITSDEVDWSTLGMIYSAFFTPEVLILY